MLNRTDGRRSNRLYPVLNRLMKGSSIYAFYIKITHFMQGVFALSPLPWFRLYHRIIDDEKLRLLAFEDRWHFVALCCLKADGLLDTTNDSLRSRKIAVKLGVQLRELDEICRRLKEVNLVDENMSPLAWDDLQFRSDSSAVRVKKYRVKQKVAKTKRPCNVTVTPQETETETETETDKINTICTSVDPDALKPQHVLEEWNKLAAKLGKPMARDLTSSRRALIKARIAQFTIDDFLAVFGKIEKSKFLRGDTGWKGCGIDWVFKSANFQKIIEGNYDE